MIAEVKTLFEEYNIEELTFDAVDCYIFSTLYKWGIKVKNYSLVNNNGEVLTNIDINLDSSFYNLIVLTYYEYLKTKDLEEQVALLEKQLASAKSKISLTNEINKNMADKIEAAESKASGIVRLRRSKFISLK